MLESPDGTEEEAESDRDGNSATHNAKHELATCNQSKYTSHRSKKTLARCNQSRLNNLVPPLVPASLDGAEEEGG
jgi:hypothetical protein